MQSIIKRMHMDNDLVNVGCAVCAALVALMLQLACRCRQSNAIPWNAVKKSARPKGVPPPVKNLDL
jgi:hypothetical protein